MRIAAISDLHGNLSALSRILERASPVEVVVFPGDITHFGTPAQCRQIIQLAQGLASTVLAVAGNCDSEPIDRELAQLGVSLHGYGRVVGGVGFYGVSAIPPWLPRMYHLSEAEIAQTIARGLTEINHQPTLLELTILVCHVPPYRCKLDRIFLGYHCGSTAVREAVEAHRPRLVLCGHIHEARGTEQIGETLVVNCGQAAKGYFALIELAADQSPAVSLLRA